MFKDKSFRVQNKLGRKLIQKYHNEGGVFPGPGMTPKSDSYILYICVKCEQNRYTENQQKVILVLARKREKKIQCHYTEEINQLTSS